MIEKLEPLQGLDHSWLNKINELVDAVNELQAQVAILEEHAHPTAKTEPDAEQRKWIGKLCKFWDADSDDCYFDKLKEITPDVCYFTKNGILYCAHDIIYKGGNNE